MGKRLLICVLVLGLVFTMGACGDYTIEDLDASTPQGDGDNPFDAVEKNAGFLGALSHGEASPSRDGNQDVLPYEYEGGEFSFSYQFSVEGKLGEIGFLLFLDGKPQAYKVNDTDAAYEYCHYFSAQNTEQEPFTFFFTPQSGQIGDTLGLTVVSITNPSFQPDMKEKTSYGWYHKILERSLKLHFNADPPTKGIESPQLENIFSAITVGEEKMTSAFIEHELAPNGWDGVSMDTLDEGVYFTTSYNGAVVYDNVNASSPETLAVRYTLCGAAGTEYAVSFFVNHQPISADGVISHEVKLSKGDVWTIEAVIDPTKLDTLNTFYIMAVPTGGSDDAPVNKSDSILLYKEN